MPNSRLLAHASVVVTSGSGAAAAAAAAQSRRPVSAGPGPRFRRNPENSSLRGRYGSRPGAPPTPLPTTTDGRGAGEIKTSPPGRLGRSRSVVEAVAAVETIRSPAGRVGDLP